MSRRRGGIVRSSVGHREKTRLGVLEGEVLVGELVAVDGLAAGALCKVSASLGSSLSTGGLATHVLSVKVTALEHELRDDTVEWRRLVAEALLAGAEGAEVGGRLWDHVVVELEADGAEGGAVGRDLEEDVGHGCVVLVVVVVTGMCGRQIRWPDGAYEVLGCTMECTVVVVVVVRGD